ncbi:hypothetical protein KO493_11645 [Tamlana agarivorans]|uniref:Uncharacterized protein n=1 Tax=Pseudotamlana agarivorans TaxID=481183 RepID=A0ACC5UAJ9_9FLAO|nr:hypothetical protein [Tamlana agarivorans]MBU2951351.1 hypothetical protein [Tamlana agarivorans]
MTEKSTVKNSEKPTGIADNLITQLKSGLSKIGELGTNTKGKFVNYVKDIFDVLPLIEKAGFRTNRLIVGVSIPPSVEIHFSRINEFDESHINNLLEEYSDKKMFKMILKALLMSNEFQSKLSSEDLIFSETCIEISIPPKISIKYLNKNIASIDKIESEFE